MGRPIYPHELKDPDFSWLISNYTEKNPRSILVDRSLTPIVLLCGEEETVTKADIPAEVALAESEVSAIKEREV